MVQNRLTDRKLQSLKRKGKRYEVMDSDVPGFGVRVSEAGQKSFILIARYPGSPNPTRRALGEYGVQINTGAGRASRALGYVMEVFPSRWMARVGNLGSDLLSFGAVKQEAIRLYRCRDKGTMDWIPCNPKSTTDRKGERRPKPTPLRWVWENCLEE
jgi:hypothetical protein